jgi:uncharacterized protein YuzE
MKLKFTYDPQADAVSIHGAQPYEESDEIAPNVILDYDAAGATLSAEILDALKQIEYLNDGERAALLKPAPEGAVWRA